MKRYSMMLGAAAVFVCMLLFPQTVFCGASAGLLLWFHTVLPTLLPFIILSNLLLSTGAADILARMLSPVLCRFFRVSAYGAFAVLIGFLCGCPMGAKITADLLKRGCISETEGRYLLSFSNNTSPMFIISYILWQNLKCPELTLPLLTLTMSAPVLLSFLFRRIYHVPKTIRKEKSFAGPASAKDGLESLDSCIMNGFETITRIGGYIILFSICISLAERLPFKTPLWTSLLLPSLELTNGVAKICSAGAAPAAIISSLSLAAFGGWCAAAQTNAMLCHTGLPIFPYIIEKLAAALATSLLIALFLFLH